MNTAATSVPGSRRRRRDSTAQLAHVGFAEGMLVITDILGETPVPIDYGKLPWAVYCHPEVAF
ncbi:MAG: hypothetical protein R2706_16780 [Acidimicrobiales bacterium]